MNIEVGFIAAAMPGVLRSLSCSLQLTSPPFGQLLCPSPSFIHPLFIRSIPPCSLSAFVWSKSNNLLFTSSPNHFIFKSQNLQTKSSSNHQIFKSLHLQIIKSPNQHPLRSPGSIPLIHRSFISAGFSPPAAHIFVLAVPAIACVPGLRCENPRSYPLKLYLSTQTL